MGQGEDKKQTVASGDQSNAEGKPAPSTSSVTSPPSSSSASAGPSSSSDAAEKKGADAGGDATDGQRKTTELLESSYDVTVTLADQQADPNSPLYSVKSFDQLGLAEELLKGVYAMKFQKPSKIQERALPLLLQNP